MNSHGNQYPAKCCEGYKGISSCKRYRHFCCRTVNIHETSLSAARVFEFIPGGIMQYKWSEGSEEAGCGMDGLEEAWERSSS